MVAETLNLTDQKESEAGKMLLSENDGYFNRLWNRKNIGLINKEMIASVRKSVQHEPTQATVARLAAIVLV